MGGRSRTIYAASGRLGYEIGHEYQRSARRLKIARMEAKVAEHGSLEAAKRAQTAARVRRWRAKKAAEKPAEV